MNMNEWIDVSPILANLLPFTLDFDPETKSIQIPNEFCNDLETLTFSQYTLLEELIIGDDCFGNIDKFVIDGLNHLKSLKIGSKSFTRQKGDWKWNKAKNSNRSFAVLNCNELKSIEIGRYSFFDYGGKFELKNLPSLTIIKIGSIETDYSESNNRGWSLNFWYSSFVIKGNIDMILLMNRSSTIEFHWTRW